MGGSSVAVRPFDDRRDRHRFFHAPHYSLAGVTVALALGCASFTPSLAPRNWLWQGIVSGLSAVAGYGVGTLLAWLPRATLGWRPSDAVTRRLWGLLAAVGVPLLAWTLWQGQRWQREIHALTNEEPPTSYAWVRILLLSLAVFLVIVTTLRIFGWLVRRLTQTLAPLVPEQLARPLAFLIVVLITLGLNNGLISRGLVAAANSVFGAANQTTDQGVSRPTAPERSGSPASLISWQSLGRQGRDFVGLGPSVAALTAFTGAPAREPVRVYAGLKSADTTRERAALAVRDLRRAGGFDRAVLVVATTTGTGLVDPAAADSIEYMYDGDTAIVGLQYSYFPSFISFLVDHEQAQDAGRQLFNQVYDAWAQLPTARRPRLLVTGTSLGVFGSEAAFTSEADLLRRTDGVVWAGPPNFSVFHRRFVQHRDPGTPEWRPVYEHGRTVQFLTNAPAPSPPPGADRPHVVYLQNGSDPVVFWSPQLAISKPDWLSEPRAPDVSPDMVWIPIVTFWQVTADLPSEYAVPAGHGHRYLGLYVDGWAAVAPPPGWTAADSQRLRAHLQQSLVGTETSAAGH